MANVLSFPVLASDFGGLVEEFLVFIGVVAALALALGAVTSALLVWRYHRKRFWLLVPLFTTLWFAAILGIIELYLNMNAPHVVEGPASAPLGGPAKSFPLPAPEHLDSPPGKETE